MPAIDEEFEIVKKIFKEEGQCEEQTLYEELQKMLDEDSDED